LAISPPSDIVLDVVRAADPLQARAAADRLGRLAVTESGETESFDEVFDSIQAEPFDPLPFDATGTLTRLRNQDLLAADRPLGGDPAVEPYRRFEAFVLQSFVETMLPSQAESVFGSGNAGAIWKSLLAEKLADQFARAGGIGIADRLAARHRAPAIPPASASG
jgi:hypothetical protein